MGADSKIEWTDHTFNPWIGCERISPACDHCYAAVSSAARALGKKHGKDLWGGDRHRTSVANWTRPLQWDKAARVADARARVFCASLADVFDNKVPAEWRRDLMHLIGRTTNLDFLLLTKRIGNVGAMLNAAIADLSHGLNDWDGLPWPNVWLGATIANQEEADRDIPKLLATPAARRFLSIEPMLGPMDLTQIRTQIGPGSFETGSCLQGDDGFGLNAARNHIDWVIAGGESGHHARPMHPRWARDIRDQCAAAGVPFLFKQWGQWWPISQMPDGWIDQDQNKPRLRTRTVLQLDGTEDDRFPPGAMTCFKVGKDMSGRLLDGRTHDDFPASAA